MDRKIDELLFALMQNMTITMSGGKLAKELGVSSSTLLRWIARLRQAGVESRGQHFTHFRLAPLPHVTLPQLLPPRLRSQLLGPHLYHFYKVDPTNAFASRLLEHDRRIADGTIILAESQTAGRGRLGR